MPASIRQAFCTYMFFVYNGVLHHNFIRYSAIGSCNHNCSRCFCVCQYIVFSRYYSSFCVQICFIHMQWSDFYLCILCHSLHYTLTQDCADSGISPACHGISPACHGISLAYHGISLVYHGISWYITGISWHITGISRHIIRISLACHGISLAYHWHITGISFAYHWHVMAYHWHIMAYHWHVMAYHWHVMAYH